MYEYWLEFCHYSFRYHTGVDYYAIIGIYKNFYYFIKNNFLYIDM